MLLLHLLSLLRAKLRDKGVCGLKDGVPSEPRPNDVSTPVGGARRQCFGAPRQGRGAQPGVRTRQPHLSSPVMDGKLVTSPPTRRQTLAALR